MKKLKCLFLFLVLICCKPVLAQNTFSFKAKVIHNKKGLMNNMSLFVNNQPVVTNDAGVLMLGLPNTISYVAVSLPPNSAYTILYPTAGHVIIPKSSNEVPEIIIGSPADNTILNQYIDLYKVIKNNKDAGSEQVSLLYKKLDTLQSTLLQLNYTESDLRSAKDKQDGRDKYYQEISGNLNDFVSRAYDLKTAFIYTSTYAFDNPNALQQLNNAVNEYTTIYNTLNRQRNNYSKYINDYWQNDSLSVQYNNLIQYALDSVHTGKFYRMTDDINSINQYFLGGNKSKDLKDKIQTNVKAQTDALTPMLDKLKQWNDMFQRELSL